MINTVNRWDLVEKTGGGRPVKYYADANLLKGVYLENTAVV